MSQFQINLIINISIGILFIFGLCWFMFKRTNWFKEGGIAYEFLKERKKAKDIKMKENNSTPIKNSKK